MTLQAGDARIVVTDAPGADDESVIRDGLSAYNLEKAGYRDHRPLAILVRDPETGEVVGGLLGGTSFGLLRIDRFFCPKACASRGSEAGSSRRPKTREGGAAAAGRC